MPCGGGGCSDTAHPGRSRLSDRRDNSAHSAGPPVAMSVERAFEAAQQELSRGRFAQAEKLYRKILQVEPNHHAPCITWAGRRRTGPIGGRRDAGAAIHRLAPRQGTYRNNLGLMLHRAGRMREAMEHCQEAARIEPSLLDAHQMLV